MADASTILAKLKKEYPELQDEPLMIDLEDSLNYDEEDMEDMDYLDDEAPEEDFMSEDSEEKSMDSEEDEDEDLLDYLDEAPKRKRK